MKTTWLSDYFRDHCCRFPARLVDAHEKIHFPGLCAAEVFSTTTRCQSRGSNHGDG
jgi:hypothetical protein